MNLKHIIILLITLHAVLSQKLIFSDLFESFNSWKTLDEQSVQQISIKGHTYLHLNKKPVYKILDLGSRNTDSFCLALNFFSLSDQKIELYIDGKLIESISVPAKFHLGQLSPSVAEDSSDKLFYLPFEQEIRLSQRNPSHNFTLVPIFDSKNENDDFILLGLNNLAIYDRCPSVPRFLNKQRMLQRIEEFSILEILLIIPLVVIMCCLMMYLALHRSCNRSPEEENKAERSASLEMDRL